MLVDDRPSFMRFLWLGLADTAPDPTTIRAFREQLTRAGAIEALFVRFDHAIREARCSPGWIPMSGRIADASLVPAPCRRNAEVETADGIPPAWKDKPARLRQKGRDARLSGPAGDRLQASGWTVVFGKIRLRVDGTRHAGDVPPADAR